MAQSISVDNIRKSFRIQLFKRKTAVDGISFEVPKGTIVGLLGPNGSGKSTTIKMIMGFLRPDSGEILVGGTSAFDRGARNNLGYLPENPRFPKFLTGREVMHFYASLYGMKKASAADRASSLLRLVNLERACDERIQGYSKGMTQRLAIAQALISNPKVLIFDEPMSGLDPLGRMEIRRLISQIHSEMPETTIFFSTHILSDVESLCSSVILLRNGKLTRHCHIEELLAEGAQRFELHLTGVSPTLQNKLTSQKSVKATPGGWTFWFEGNTDDLIGELTSLRSAGATVTSLNSQRKTLEEALFGDEIQNKSTSEAQA